MMLAGVSAHSSNTHAHIHTQIYRAHTVHEGESSRARRGKLIRAKLNLKYKAPIVCECSAGGRYPTSVRTYEQAINELRDLGAPLPHPRSN